MSDLVARGQAGSGSGGSVPSGLKRLDLHGTGIDPLPRPRTVIAYSDPREAGQTYMIFGNATLGVSMHEQPLVHCHATFRTEAGEVRGGHVLTEHCIVGADPIPVLITALDGFELRQAYDPETNMQLLLPHEVANDE